MFAPKPWYDARPSGVKQRANIDAVLDSHEETRERRLPQDLEL